MSYNLLLDKEDDQGNGSEISWPRKQIKRNCARNTMLGLIALLAISNMITIYCLSERPLDIATPKDYARTEAIAIGNTWNRFLWNTEYSPHNHSAADELWDSILPSHGFVAMDRQWTAARHWPESMYLPKDRSKGVYLLEAYHQLHCLRILRKTFWEAVEQKPYTHHPDGHIDHCFDALRQATQCNADTTPLYTFGDDTAGNGQLHKCRNWEQLRDFATEHTACYVDSVEPILLENHFGVCDNGSDGLLPLQVE